jgi:hypothetical protein
VLFRHTRAAGGNRLLIEHNGTIWILCPESFQEIGAGHLVILRVLLVYLVYLGEWNEVRCIREGCKMHLLGDVLGNITLDGVQSALDWNRLEFGTRDGRGRRHFGRLGKKVSVDIHESVLDRTEATISSQERVPNTL